MVTATLAPSDLVRVVPATRADIHRRSSGPITRNPIAGDLAVRGDGALEPERGGFYCEALFGPLRHPLADRFAHIDLPEPVPHPYWPCTIDTIAVAPATLRPLVFGDDGTATVPELTELYQRLYQRGARLRRLLELGAPAQVLDGDRKTLAGDVAVVFDNPFAPRPFVRVDRTRVESLASLLDTDDAAQLEHALFAIGLRLERC